VGREENQEKDRDLNLRRSTQSRGTPQMPIPVPTRDHSQSLGIKLFPFNIDRKKEGYPLK
jgi:hypothetical protein